MQRVYVDSNVVISVIKAEMGAPFKLMYHHAENFLASCKNRFAVVLSDLAVHEICGTIHYSRDELLAFLASFEVALVLVFTEDADKRRAREIEALGVHYPDSLHVALALKAKANVLVTWNLKDFEPAGHRIPVKDPEEFTAGPSL